MGVNNRSESYETLPVQGNEHEMGNIYFLEKTRMLWMVLSHKSAASDEFLAANVNGIGNRMFSHIASKTDARIRNNYWNSVIDDMDEEAVAQLCIYFIGYYKSYKGSYAYPVTVSYSIYATKISTIVAIHQQTGKIVYYAYPNRVIEFPEMIVMRWK